MYILFIIFLFTNSKNRDDLKYPLVFYVNSYTLKIQSFVNTNTVKTLALR